MMGQFFFFLSSILPWAGSVSTNKVSDKTEIQKEVVEVMGDKEAFSAENEDDEG